MENQTVKQLRTLAKERGIKGYYKLRKAELIEALGRQPHNPANTPTPKPRTKKAKPLEAPPIPTPRTKLTQPPPIPTPTAEPLEAPPTKLRPPTVLIVRPLKTATKPGNIPHPPPRPIPAPRTIIPYPPPKPISAPRKNIVSGFIDSGRRLANAIPQTTNNVFNWIKNQTSKVVDRVKSVGEELADLINANISRLTGNRPPQPRRKVSISESVRAELAEREAQSNTAKPSPNPNQREVNADLNNDLSSMIFQHLKPDIEMRSRIVYGFTARIYRGDGEIVVYEKI